MRPSLRRRLLFLLSGAVIIAWLATAAFTYFDARHEIGEILDAQLSQSASLIAAQLEHVFDEEEEGEAAHENQRHQRGNEIVLPPQYKHERKIAVQVWDRQGRLRLRSASAPETRLYGESEGHGNVMIGGKRWRVFSRLDESRRYLVQVGERHELREELAEHVAEHLLYPLYFALPGLALLIWLVVSAGLAPLAGITRQVARRAPDNLARLDEERAPREILPLIAALNTLFGRVGASLEQERRFTADAAHELRTPLAAVKTQAQVAFGATHAAERDRALANVVAGADRATRLAEQLLMLARLDPQTALPPGQTVDLLPLAQQGVAEIAQAAAAKNIEIGLTAAETGTAPTVAGDAVLLGVLLRNLLDNAVRYTPAGGEVDVAVRPTGTGVSLAVTDTGPGIPAEKCERAFDRFYRALGSGEEGSGLGLSIVRRIADLHRARVHLGPGPDGRGLRVEVTFS
ncbi:MAG: sensor histidine kinase N-terminal domain-containing protein [Zoogloeaceae bacterium]|jgi:two-component system sensor histidine kinase QseC|nr:sensor histidine kinase N-terminal domain-containing protein [Zoogloeaceae bacterium]